MTIEEATEALHRANANNRDIGKAIVEACLASSAAIRADWQGRVNDAEAAVADARAALDAARLAQPPHPWVGQTVWRNDRTYPKGSYYSREVVLRGIVETVTHDTVLPANEPSRPPVGTPIVRILKANGQPGLKWQKLVWATGGERWQIGNNS